MTTVIHEHHREGDNGGLIIYLTKLRSTMTGPHINVPEKIDVNVNTHQQ